ncbi:MAG TPA: hypothetical protein PKE65_10200 [Rhizobiaceae bacterium]|nr:hypothetical protein [Rhizobiaceae bacterium]
MTIPTLALWSLTSAALFTSICALFVALRSSARSLSKRLSELSERQSTQEESLEALSVALRNLRSRLNMANYRDRKRGKSAEPTDEPQQDGREWVRKANMALALRRSVPPVETEE